MTRKVKTYTWYSIQKNQMFYLGKKNNHDYKLDLFIISYVQNIVFLKVHRIVFKSLPRNQYRTLLINIGMQILIKSTLKQR